MFKRLILLITFIVLVFFNSVSISFDTSKTDYIKVEVRGNLNNPGVFKLNKGSIFNDLLNVLDLNDNSDISLYSKLDVLYNNQIIVINDIKSSLNLISINSASLEELTSIKGIGESIAKKIIEYRNVYGSFTNIDELLNVSGIGTKKYESIKQYICI